MPESPSPDDSAEADSDAEQAENESDLPAEIVEEAERLTRLAREAVDDNEAAAYREERDRLLAETDFTARVRGDDRDTLVLHPEEWVVDGTVYPDRIDDVDRGIERPLEGPGPGDDWEVVEEANRSVARAIESEHGPVHGTNAHALADFASNHYAKPIEDLSSEELREFLTDYFPRNAFPTDDQKAVVEESVRLTVEGADGNPDAVSGAVR